MAEHDRVNPEAPTEDADLPLSRGAKTDRAARKVEIAERRRRITQLLYRRVSQREIARLLNISTGTVSEDMKAVRKEWQAEAVVSLEAHIARELATMDNDEQMLRVEMAAAKNTDQMLRVFDRVLRVQESRRKLLGLDAPIRMELARAEAMRLAAEYDLDPVELLKMAEDILKEHTG